MIDFARLLIIIGLTIAGIGLLLLLTGRFFPWLGQLPGDFRFEGERFSLFFPLATMILISIIGSIILNVVIRIFRR